MAYDTDGNETLVVTGYGTPSAESTFYAYDGNGNQTEVITGYNSSQQDTTLSKYDGDGNLTQQTDPDGDVSDFAYDALGDQTLSELGVGTPQQANSQDYYDGDGNLTLSIDGDGNSSNYLYDADGNETLAIQGYGSDAASTSSYAYDAAGEQTLAVTGYGTPAAESTFYAYDANGNQTLTITGYNSSKPETTISLYDGDGNLTQQIDPDGDTSDFAYDSLGDQTLSVLGAGTAQVTSSYDYYDGDDNLTLSVDADGDSTSYLYDADGNNTLMIEGVGTSSASTTSMAYDSDGDNTLMIEGVGTSAASTTSMAYDAASNQTLTITGYNSSKPETTIAQYDGDGNLTQEVDPDGDTTDFAYDALGDQTLSVAGVGSDPGTTSDFYDGDGNLTLTVNPVGDSTSYQYDADGNETLEIDGYGSSSAATIHYLYDASGNQTQEVDPDGNTTSWQYDADGDQTLMIQAYGTSAAANTSYEYDNDGNQTLQINPNGTSIASSYDADGNLTSETWYNANGSVANSSSYTYDGDGNILTAGNDAGTYTFGYNADGEQTLVVNPNGVTLNYQYDADGNATEITDSLGDTVTSQYDTDGDLISRGYSGPNGAQLLVQLGYDDDGNLSSISRYSDLAGTQLVGTSSYAYDAQGNVTSIVHDNASGTTLDSFNYSYDAADELTQQVDNGTTTAYGYDATGQLISAGPTDYNYDANGNPDNSGDSVGPNNELLSDGTWNYSYDANGNMTGKTGVASGPDDGLTWTYAYDPGNELISATETNSQGQTLVQESFTYDVFGNILSTSLSTDGGSPVDTDYVYNGGNLLATTDASNVPEDFYLGGDQADQYFAQYDATNGASWYLTNNLGSVCTTMDNSGAAIDNIVYDAWGNITSQSNSAQQLNIGYDGYQTFAAIDLDESGIRFYNPQMEQWMQQDPILVTAGPNPREYVDDAPTNATDPTGQFLVVQNGAEDKWLEYLNGLGISATAYPLPARGWFSSQRWGILTTRAGEAKLKEKDGELTADDGWTHNVIRSLTTWGNYNLEGNKELTIWPTTLSNEEVHVLQQARAQEDDGAKYHRNEYDAGPSYVAEAAKGTVDGLKMELNGLTLGNFLSEEEKQALKGEYGEGIYWASNVAGFVAGTSLLAAKGVQLAGVAGNLSKAGLSGTQIARVMTTQAIGNAARRASIAGGINFIEQKLAQMDDPGRQLDGKEFFRSMLVATVIPDEVFNNKLVRGAAGVASVAEGMSDRAKGKTYQGGFKVLLGVVAARSVQGNLPVGGGGPTLTGGANGAGELALVPGLSVVVSVDGVGALAANGITANMMAMAGNSSDSGREPTSSETAPKGAPNEINAGRVKGPAPDEINAGRVKGPAPAEVPAPKSSVWEGLPLRANSYGAAEEAAGSFVNGRIPLSRSTPNGVYKFVVDQEGKVWLSPVAEDVAHSALVPKGAQVRGAGYVAIKNGKANVNGRSGHYMAENPVSASQTSAYDNAIRTTFQEQGVEVVENNVGIGGGAIKPP